MRTIFDLAGRTALVTGASSGLGARFAQTLAAAGAKVVLAARRKDRTDLLAGEITARGGVAMSVVMDVVDEASVVAAFDEASAAFGAPEIVVANAGVSAKFDAMEMPMERFDALMAVNLRGVFLTAREGAKRMSAAGSRRKQNGRIVIVSSITAKKVYRGLAAYAASKAAVLQLGKVMAADWAQDGINVNMILPGYVRTEMTDRYLGSDDGQELQRAFLRRRLVDESDLDGALLFFASDASKSVTGAHITVDDGQSL